MDARLYDDSSLVVVFVNRDFATPNDQRTPTIRIELDLADGRSSTSVSLRSRPLAGVNARCRRADRRERSVQQVAGLRSPGTYLPDECQVDGDLLDRG